MSVKKTIKRSLLGAAADLLTARALKHKPISGKDLYTKNFRISTQRMGVRFTEHLRDVFRPGWLRKIR